MYFTYSSNDTVIVSAIEKIRNSAYGKDPSSSFYKMDNDRANGVHIESSNSPSNFSPSVNDYGQTHINLNSNEGNNSNYVVRDKNGNVSSGNVSPESMLIHEIQHAYDNSTLSTDEYNRQSTPGSGQTGEDSTIMDDRAIEEANKYRREKGEPERIWYNDINSYNRHHE